MAQTRKRRRTKHRGNAAGMIEARGRTGRPPAAGEKGAGKQDPAARRQNRLAKPPTWRSAFNRAAGASVIFGILVFLLFDRSAVQAATIAVVLLPLYVPATYYTDRMIHKRWLKKNGPGAA